MVALIVDCEQLTFHCRNGVEAVSPVRTQVNHTLSLVDRPSVLRNIELYRATYDLADLFSRYGVDLVLTGHDHYREQTVFKGVEYVIVDALEEKTDNAGNGLAKLAIQ